jgi:type IX secretion system PorP/SprF family membrane protein
MCGVKYLRTPYSPNLILQFNLRKMKYLYIFFLLFLGVFQMNAQQEQHYTQFMHNKLMINPAYAGARGVPFITGIYRNQWLGFEGAPKSGLVSFNTPFLTKRVGAGITLSHRSIGLERNTSLALSYSYNLIQKDGLSLRGGLMGSARYLGIDFNRAKATIDNDLSILTNDVSNSFYGNFGVGLYGSVEDKFYMGVSVPSLISNNVSLKNPSPSVISNAKEFRHAYLMAGASLPLSEDVYLLPAILVKYVKNAPLDADINLNLDVKKKVTAGLSYRMGGDGRGDSIDLLFFMQASPMLGLGIAYDFTLSQIKDYSSGSFELLTQIDLKQKKNNMSNPRFFF